MKKRMGKMALRQTWFGFTTQKAESTNHAFCVTNPKHSMSCSRNGVNRDHSSIHLINHLPGDSIVIKAKNCGVPISPNSPCLDTLHQMNRRKQYFGLRSRSKSYKFRRTALRRKRFNLYDRCKNESCYEKGQLDPT